MSTTSTTAPAAGGSFVVSAGNLFFRQRNWLFPVLFLVITLASKPMMFLGSAAADRWLDGFGILIILGGQAIRVAVIGLAYIRRGGKNKKIYADDLVITGIFAHSRNPLYVGNVMVYAGLLTVLNSMAGWLVGLPFFLFAYYAITLAEENFLRGKFGSKYDEYCRTVNRYFPSLQGLEGDSAEHGVPVAASHSQGVRLGLRLDRHSADPAGLGANPLVGMERRDPGHAERRHRVRDCVRSLWAGALPQEGAQAGNGVRAAKRRPTMPAQRSPTSPPHPRRSG